MKLKTIWKLPISRISLIDGFGDILILDPLFSLMIILVQLFPLRVLLNGA